MNALVLIGLQYVGAVLVTWIVSAAVVCACSSALDRWERRRGRAAFGEVRP